MELVDEEGTVVDVMREELMAKILVIGYGNPLRGDDSFGHRAVEKLKEEVTATKWNSSIASS